MHGKIKNITNLLALKNEGMNESTGMMREIKYIS